MPSAGAPAANGNAGGAIITEVVVQGVRRFGDVRRFTLGPGYNVLYGLGASGKTTLHDVMMSLLFAKPAEGEQAAMQSLLPQGKVACRAGMTLMLGGEQWRVLKDYQQGGVTLSRFNVAEKKYELVLSEPAAIRRWLVETAKMPAGPEVATICGFSKTEFPSVADGIVVPIARREMEDTGFEERIRALPLGEKRALLTKLLDEYRRHAELQTTEYLQDGLRSKAFEAEALMKKREELQKKIDEIDLEYKDLEKLPKLPDGIEDRIEAYKRHEKEREAQMADLLPRQEEAKAALAATIPPEYDEKTFRRLKDLNKDMLLEPLKRDRILDVGVGLLPIGFVMLFLGSAIATIGIIVAIVGLGVTAWRGILYFYGALEKFQKQKKITDAVDDQIRQMERRWDVETSVVRNLMKAYDVDDPREMREMEKRRDEFAEERAKVKAQLDTCVLPGNRMPDREHARITQQISDLDQRLQDLSKDLTGDPKELEPQIERLDREVARAEGRKPTPRAKLFQNDENAPASDTDGKNSVTRLLDAWCAARRADLGRVLRGIQESYARNLKALSGGRFSEASFDAEGNVTVREEIRGATPWEMIDGPGRDVCYLALRITLFQLDAKGDGRAVLVLDDPFEFEEGRLLAISRALRALSPGAQVLHLTSRPQHGKLADTNVEI